MDWSQPGVSLHYTGHSSQSSVPPDHQQPLSDLMPDIAMAGQYEILKMLILIVLEETGHIFDMFLHPKQVTGLFKINFSFFCNDSKFGEFEKN